ncbi:hypothetical protein [Pseudochelatococcus sp. B33]
MRFSRKEPGLIASAAAHAALLTAAVVAFSSPPKFADQQESIAVEVISEEAFSTMTQGDRTAKTVQETPQPRVDRVDEIEAQKPEPGEEKRDVPAPVARPVAEDKSEDRAVAEPLPAPPAPAPPEPAPTPAPAPAPEPPPEPVKVAEPTPPPPMPQPRPQQLAQAQEPKPEPPKPEPPKPAPKKPEPPKPEPPKPEPPKPAPPKPTPPKPAPTRAASRSTVEKPANADSIEKLLASRDRPQASGSTGRQQQAASAGTRTGNAPKLSLSQRDAIGNLMKEQIGRCFSAPPGMADVTTSPVIRVSLNEDGTLAGPPQVVSGAGDAASRSFAESLMRAIRRCAPYTFPAQYAPYYNDWRDWRIDAAPGDFLG